MIFVKKNGAKEVWWLVGFLVPMGIFARDRVAFGGRVGRKKWRRDRGEDEARKKRAASSCPVIVEKWSVSRRVEWRLLSFGRESKSDFRDLGVFGNIKGKI